MLVVLICKDSLVLQAILVKMESSPPKRRKLEHDLGNTSGQNKNAFGAAATAGLFRPSTFILETEELLKESRVDYGKAFAKADDLLRRLKGAIESIDSHESLPVIVNFILCIDTHNLTML